MRRALRRAENAANLDVIETATLLAARDEDLARLLRVAASRRDAHLESEGRAGLITYSPKVFVPLTRLCRDRCHYCTFATVPHRLPAAFLEREEVVEIARAGAAQGCLEALFTLGDRPERRWQAARDWLGARGYGSTIDYLRACAVAVLEETGLLPHLNPGVMSWEELARCRPVAPSMGMMLESTSTRLTRPGGPHHGSPDKDPVARLRVIDDAGRLAIPFTSGILVGIGEDFTERAESLLALRSATRRYGHLQEVIVQNFRAKPDTAMRGAPEVDFDEFIAAVAVARLILPPGVSIQAPPNLAGETGEANCDSVHRDQALLLRAGIDDWGGLSPVTPDHVNPERPWPALENLREVTAAAGFSLSPRLTLYPRYAQAGAPWIDPRVAPHVAALAAQNGLANDALPVGRPWQEPDGGWESTGRTDLETTIDTVGRTADRRSDFDSVYGAWEELRPQAISASPETRRLAHLATATDTTASAALRRAELKPASLLDPSHTDEAMALLTADGDALEALCTLADGYRAQVVGDNVTYVVNRNINFSNICYVGCRFCAFAQRERDADAFRLSAIEVADRAAEAAERGATEVCMQGGIDPAMPVSGYLDLIRAVKSRVPSMHVHAFSPMEVVTAAAKAGVSIEEWLTGLREAGLDSMPGTAAEILDDDVRWILTKGKLPASTWVEVITTAHRLGIPSSSTMMYGHVDHPTHWLAHLRTLAEVQDLAHEHGNAGFTEFVALPFIHRNAPIYLGGIARPGPTVRDNRAVHAFARLALHRRIDHIQCSWVKLGDELTAKILQGGADDLGGTLMEETISRMAGSTHGSARTADQLADIAARAGRPLVQRTTTYSTPPNTAEMPKRTP
ncbi:bifunctional FO biosynthesis protein CofGH [Saccharopolyspora sp. NPDC000995]